MPQHPSARGGARRLPRFQQPVVGAEVADGMNAIARYPRPEPAVDGLVEYATTLQTGFLLDGLVIKRAANSIGAPHRHPAVLGLRPPQGRRQVQVRTGLRVP